MRLVIEGVIINSNTKGISFSSYQAELGIFTITNVLTQSQE